ncbi:response regulator [Paraburkholderia susongensis]|uniref:response regulator n=1 Tax=Paraburkholderia susongensis TaxID=1515439 RepID=UPI00142E84B5|nr:response regulator [Paraburkholderia susongensis]
MDNRYVLLSTLTEAKTFLSSERDCDLGAEALADLSKSLLRYFDSQIDVRPEILFVDDEEMACKYFPRMFLGDYKIVTAGTFDAATALLERYAGTLRLLISDQRLSSHGGTELLSIARRQYPWIARTICTGYMSLDDTIASINDGGVQYFLSKPVDADAWRKLVQDGVQKGRANWANHQLLQENMLGYLQDLLIHRITALQVAALNVEELKPDYIDVYVRVAAQLGRRRDRYLDWSQSDYSTVIAQEANRTGQFVCQVAAALGEHGSVVRALIESETPELGELARRLPDLFDYRDNRLVVNDAEAIVGALLGHVAQLTTQEQVHWFMFVVVCAQKGLEPLLEAHEGGAALYLVPLADSSQSLASAIHALKGGE